MLLVGSFLMTSSLALLSVSFRVEGFIASSKTFKITLVLLFVGAYSISWGPIAWILPSELVSTRRRSQIVSLGTVLNWSADFLVVSTWLPLSNSLGLSEGFAGEVVVEAYQQQRHM